MKLTTFLLFGFFFQLSAGVFSQTNGLMNLKAEKESVSQILKMIEDQTEFSFLYNSTNIDVERKTDINCESKNIEEVLGLLFKGTNVKHRSFDHSYVLYTEDGPVPANEQQQQKTISGKVTDASGNPIPGVSVVLKGTTIGVNTDNSGKFSISTPENGILQFSFVGMQSQEIATNGKSNINVILEDETIGIEEVVAIGYGTVKKSDLTGSVSSIKKGDMNKGVITSMNGLLQGKAAGVQITQASAEPGGGVTIQIRGAGSINAGSGPLYVVDGLPIETGQVLSSSGESITETRTPRSPISNIDPSDIESIEVLKDASATAIYGARGANGVIIVTTKKGSSGNMKINYHGYAGIQNPIQMIDVLNAEDYKRILNQILLTPGSNVSATELISEIQDGGTNWQDQVLRKAMVQSHSLSLNGGNSKTKYFASLNYFNQDGVLINSGYQRYDSRLNLEHKEEHLLFGVNFSTSYSHDNFTTVGYGSNEESDVLYATRNFDPTLRIFDENGRYSISPLINTDNPLAIANGEINSADNYRTLGTLFGEYTILKGWTAKVNIGFDLRNSRRDAYVTRITKSGLAIGGIGTILTGTRNNYLGEFTSTYNLDLKKNSSITAMAGITYQKFINSNFSGTGKGFPVDASLTNNMGIADQSLYAMSSSKNNNKLLSYIGRLNYNLFNKFLFTATFRADGSSRFGENNKYGYFPSGAFAWKMQDYKFIKNLKVFSTLKFRSSVGLTGNQDIANFLSITTFGKGGTTVLDGQQTVTLEPKRISNPDLKWETTEQINFGFDMGFIQNRVLASFDYFQKNTNDMLFDLPIPSSNGFTSIMQNIGNIKNVGFEFTIDSKNLTGKFKWNTSLNFSTLKNTVTNMGSIPEINYQNAGVASLLALIRVGEPLNSFYGYKTNGIWQSQQEITASGTLDPVKPGDIKYVDINGDKVVNTSDRVTLGKSFPSITMGLTNAFSYKNFELNIFVDALEGVSMLNTSKCEAYFPVSHRRNRLAEPYLNRWTPENPTSQYPSFVNPGNQGNKAVNDLTVEDASYIRLQSAQINYQVPLKNKKIFDKINIYVSGQNLYCWTNYSGQDPTTNSNGDSSLKIDFNSYPVARTFILGVELGF